MSRKRSHPEPAVGAMLRARELGGSPFGANRNSKPAFTASQKTFLGGQRIPNSNPRVVDRFPSRGYCGRFSGDGNLYFAAFQERRIRVYDYRRNYKLTKDIQPRNLQWTITDATSSPDSRFLVYTTIAPVAHLVRLEGGGVEGNDNGPVESIQNVTDLHETLEFGVQNNGRTVHHGGVWSIRYLHDGTQLVAGTSDGLAFYDIPSMKASQSVTGVHEDDVNAVAVDGGCGGSSQMIYSGSDDTLIKVWDHRILGGAPTSTSSVDPFGDGDGMRDEPPKSQCKAVGVLAGHTEGITHIDARGDGRYICSNSKDQTLRIWDLRMMYSSSDHRRREQEEERSIIRTRMNFDYRWMEYPMRGYDIRHPLDCSVKTFRGHSTLQTLIRAYFSPAQSTGHRYLYTGGYDGYVRIFDILSGQVVECLSYHNGLVRDVAWHPTDHVLNSLGWDGRVVTWEHNSDGDSCHQDSEEEEEEEEEDEEEEEA